MTIEEFKEKKIEILDKCNAELEVIIDKMKAEGTLRGGLTIDPPEVQAVKEKAFSELSELWKLVEV